MIYQGDVVLHVPVLSLNFLLFPFCSLSITAVPAGLTAPLLCPRPILQLVCPSGLFCRYLLSAAGVLSGSSATNSVSPPILGLVTGVPSKKWGVDIPSDK